ncbi:uncharacterized protein LOC143876662 [Tasmannia lanceolata]|uniref:uncharacterized protein LOC143876662 n=1 Tax=Tasmannia lanceolata TaxID=3420 RepID=UPI004063F64D
MPHVDLETLMCGGDRKIVCETLIDGEPLPENPDFPAKAPDLPAESFRLRKDEEIDWVDRNAVFERKQSTRGNSNSNSISNSNLGPNSGSASQRFYSHSKSKASILGLPKLPDSGQLCQHLRRSYLPASIRIFPKQSGKSVVTEMEPASPKVSCIGRVRPKEKKKGRRRKDQKKATEEKPVPEKKTFWASFLAVFRLGCRHRGAVECDDESPAGYSNSNKIPVVGAKILVKEPEPQSDPPGLTGLKRFASGRRAGSWRSSDDVEFERDFHVEDSDTLDRNGIWSPRAISRPRELDCDRGREFVGPASC